MKARQAPREAQIVAANDLADAAGRAAYLAAYHAAQAYVFHATERVAKTHGGLRSECARIARADTRIDRSFPTFLARAYSLKENADYAIGHRAGITIADAQQAIAMATVFVDRIGEILEAET